MRKLHATGAKAETPVGMFTKAAELGAFAGKSPCELGVARIGLLKAGLTGRAETCRDSLAAQVGCTVRTVSRALAVWQAEKLCRVVKTLTGMVILWDVDRLRAVSRAVDAVRAAGRELVLTVKEMRAKMAQAIELLRKGHGVTGSGHGVPRSSGELVFQKGGEVFSEPSSGTAAYLAQLAQRQQAWRS